MSLIQLTNIFRSVFVLDTLILRPDLSATDVEGWDSFNHINLIIAIEEGFAVKFTTREITAMKNVGDLVRLLAAKGHDVQWEQQ